MEFLGIKWAPVSVPIRRRLQTLTVASWFLLSVFGPILSLWLTLYLLCTRLWPLMIAYLVWIYIDRDVHLKGGRTVQWVRNLFIWQLLLDYFPLNTVFAKNFTFDPNKNYVSALAPHGVYPIGPICSINNNLANYSKLYPESKHRIATLDQCFYFPFFREFLLAVGAIGVSKRAIVNVFRQEKGIVLGMCPGGVAEAFFTKSGRYKTLIRKRKGFVRVALETGASLVPLFTFGEDNVFELIENDRMKKLQYMIKKWTGFALVIPNGRGFFQYSFGLIPRRTPLNTIIGAPIHVEQVENPTCEEVDALHAKFIQAMIDLFEEHKKEYVKDWENAQLEI